MATRRGLNSVGRYSFWSMLIMCTGKNTYTINENASFVACKEVAVGINAENVNYIFVSC